MSFFLFCFNFLRFQLLECILQAVHVCLIVYVFIYLCTFVFLLQMSRANQVLLLSQLLHFLQHDCLPQILLLLLLLLLIIFFFLRSLFVIVFTFCSALFACQLDQCAIVSVLSGFFFVIINILLQIIYEKL